MNTRGLALVVGFAAMLGATCQCPPKEQDASTPATPGAGQGTTPGAALIPDNCQQDSLLIYVAQDTSHLADTVVTAADIPLIRRIANLPEFHDCQRFVVDSGITDSLHRPLLQYGPLVAIWAADSLVERFRAGQKARLAPGAWSDAVPVAVIYNWGSAAYAPLGIQPQFNCLYLWHDGSRPTRWNAMMVPNRTNPSACEATMPVERLQGQRLEVRATPPPDGLTAVDLPAVARWDWDARHNEQYIDIRCGNQSCEIGHSGFAPSRTAAQQGQDAAWLRSVLEPIPGIPHPMGSDAQIARVVAIKGWYDAQPLDLRDTQHKPVLTDIRGTVIPHPALDSAPFTPGEWTPVAYAMASAEYASPKIPLGKGLNRIYLCRDGAKKCAGAEALSCAAEMAAPHDTWYTKVTPESGASKVYCVIRRTHGGEAIPVPAARWNWNELDATTWSKCGPACCTGV